MCIKFISSSITASFIFLLFTSAVQASECVFRRALYSFKDTSFDPSISNQRNQIHPQLETNATLFRRGKNNPAIYELVNEIDVNEKERSLTIKLNTSCRWSDGHQITANDILLGFQRIFSPESAERYVPGRNMLRNAKSILAGELPVDSLGVHVINSTTIKFDLDISAELLMSALSYIAFTPAPSHLSSNDLQKWYSGSLVRISTGPFKAIKQTDEIIKLDRNKYYCNGLKSNITHIYLLGQKDKKSASVLFKQNLIDVAEETTDRDLKSLDDQDRVERPFYIKNMNEQIMTYLIISNIGVLKNPLVREALMLAIDHDRLDLIFQYGKDTSSRSRSLNFDFPDYSPPTLSLPDKRNYAENIVLAKKMMSDAGFSEKKPLKVLYKTEKKEPYILVGNAISSMLKLINIEVIKNNPENQTTEIPILKVAPWGTDYSDPENTLAGLVSMIKSDDFYGFKQQIADTNSIRDPQSRLTALYKIEENMLSKNHYLPLVKVSSPWVISTSFIVGEEFYVIGRNMLRKDC